MNQQFFIPALFALMVLGLPAAVSAQVLSCGPGLGYDSASHDHITYIGATCLRTMTIGKAAAGAHVGYGFGQYDSDFPGIDGSYNAIRINLLASYPFQVSDSSPVEVYPFVAPGVFSWWEDCDFDDCSDTNLIMDFGGGVAYNQFAAELYALTGVGFDFGARVRALFALR